MKNNKLNELIERVNKSDISSIKGVIIQIITDSEYGFLDNVFIKY